MNTRKPTPSRRLSTEEIAMLKHYSMIRLPMEQIAGMLKMSKPTLERAIKKDPAARDALDYARANSSALVRKTLFDMATKDKNFNALKFWCQTQEGFKIVEKVEHTGADGGPIASSQLTPEQRRQEIQRLLAIREAGLSEHDDEDDDDDGDHG